MITFCSLALKRWPLRDARALPARTARRDPRPAARLGEWWAEGAAEEGGPRVEGAFALQRREDAVVLRQRPEAVLSLLLLRQARRHLHIPDGNGGAVVPGGRRAPCRRGGRAAAEADLRGAAEATSRRRTCTRSWNWRAQFFERQLQAATGPGRAGLSRRARHLRPTTQAEFRIGFAPDEPQRALAIICREGESTEGQIVAAGLAVRPEDGRAPYDRFRGRLIIPIQDAKGRVVAFGGRALAPEVPAEVPQQPGDRALPQGRDGLQRSPGPRAGVQDGTVIVVEGYLDAIAVFQAGVKSVVATLGTAFTEEQIEPSGAWRPSRWSASTATRPGGKRGLPGDRPDPAGPRSRATPSGSRSFRAGRTRTTSSGAAASSVQAGDR